MRRFDYDDNEDHHEDVDGFFGGDMDDNDDDDDFITPEEYKEMFQDQQIVQQMQLDLAHRDLDDRLLFKTIKMLEKSFWWKFYSHSRRLRLINETYTSLKQLNHTEE